MEQLGLITQNETAELLGIKLRTLQRWIKRGDFPPPVRIGRKAFYDKGTVFDYLRNAVRQSQGGGVA